MPQSTAVVEIEGLNELIARMNQAPKLVRQLAGNAIEKSVSMIHRRVAKYPPPIPPGHWAAHTSPAQKRAFFAQLAAGGWSKRTGTLGRTITTRVDRTKLEGRVGTNLKGARYVIGDEQAAFHKDRWVTFRQAAKELMPKIEGEFAKANSELARRLAG